MAFEFQNLKGRTEKKQVINAFNNSSEQMKDDFLFSFLFVSSFGFSANLGQYGIIL
jgi:hypothetical protein